MSSESVDLVVDAGGTGTRLGLASRGELLVTERGPTCNTRAGGDAAFDRLAGLVERLWAARPSGVERIDTACFGLSEASTPSALRGAVRRLAERFEPLGARELWFVNDIVPLAVTDSPAVAVVCGTGTGFAAIGPDGDWARASGLEWLLSDEGGGTEIGIAGLRAVVRAADGRGQPTALSALTEPWCGAKDIEELFAAIHGQSHPKAELASFAPWVLRAADAGDRVAAAILERAADELVLGAVAVATRAGVPDGARLRYGGSLLVGDQHALRDAFLGRLGARFDPKAAATDPLVDSARAAEHLRHVPSSLDAVPLAVRLDDRRDAPSRSPLDRAP